MKIVHKLVLTLSIVIFLVITLGAVGGGAIIWMRRSADELGNVSHHDTLIANLSAATHQWVISAEFMPKEDTLLDYFYLSTVLLEERISSLMDESLPVKEMKMVDEVLVHFNKLKDQVVGLRGEEKTISTEDMKIDIQELLNQVEVLANNHKFHMDMIKARADKIRNMGVYIYIAIPSVCVILTIFIGLSIGRDIVYSIRYLVSATEVMGKGDLTKVVDLKSKDEFGVLARAFDNMRFGLKIYHEHLNELNKTLKQSVEERKQAEERLIIYQKQLKSLASELSLTEERERRRIASDLHDSIGQALIVVKMKLDELREMKISVVADSMLYDIHELLEKTIHDTRSLTFELSPPILYELGFEPAVEWLTENIQEQHNIIIDFVDDGQFKPLNDDIRVLLFKAVRELLINVVKHAEAKNAKVFTKRDGDNIRIEVEDNGIGFDGPKVHFSVGRTGGFGLFNMRERLEYLGGHLEIKTLPGNGTQVTLMAPLKSEDNIREKPV